MARTLSQYRMFGFPNDGTKRGNSDRRGVLEQNKRLRNRANPLGHQPWGSSVLHIPELDFYVLARRHPELMSPDAEINKKAWDKFLASSESEPYRIRQTDKKGVLHPNKVIR